MKYNSRRSKGFTLIEVIISLAIISVLMGVIYKIIVSGLSNTIRNQEKQTEALYVQNILEKIKTSDVVTDNNGTIKKIGDIDIVDGEGTEKLDNGYSACMKITQDSRFISINDRDNTDDISLYKSQIRLKGDGNRLKVDMDEKTNNYYEFVGNETEIVLLLENINGIIKLSVKDKNNKEIVSNFITQNDSSIKKFIRVDFDLEDYKLKHNVNIKIYNQSEIALNLCIYKNTSDFEVTTESKLGSVNIYNNRKKSSNKCQLYDINLKIRKYDKEVFSTNVKQNMNVNIQGDDNR